MSLALASKAKSLALASEVVALTSCLFASSVKFVLIYMVDIGNAAVV